MPFITPYGCLPFVATLAILSGCAQMHQFLGSFIHPVEARHYGSAQGHARCSAHRCDWRLRTTRQAAPGCCRSMCQRSRCCWPAASATCVFTPRRRGTWQFICMPQRSCCRQRSHSPLRRVCLRHTNCLHHAGQLWGCGLVPACSDAGASGHGQFPFLSHVQCLSGSHLRSQS